MNARGRGGLGWLAFLVVGLASNGCGDSAQTPGSPENSPSSPTSGSDAAAGQPGASGGSANGGSGADTAGGGNAGDAAAGSISGSGAAGNSSSGTMPDGTGSGSPGGDGGTSEPEPNACFAQSVSEADSVDLDIVPWVTLSGKLTVNGELLPDSEVGESRGGLLFDDAAGVRASYSIGPTGSDYTVTLPRGTYKVTFEPFSSCERSAPFMPCSLGAVVENLAVQDDGTFDIELPRVEVVGNVTVNGQPLQTELSGRGGLVFVDSDTGETNGVALGLGTEGALRYFKTLLPAHYDIYYRPGNVPCANGFFPCNGGRIAHNVDLTHSQELDIDIPAVHLRGSVTLNGGLLPDDGASRGGVRAVPTNPGPFDTWASTEVGDDAAGSYAFTLLPKSYRVTYLGDSQGCLHVADRTIPCVGGVATESVEVAADTELDIDLSGAEVRGQVTLDGGAYPLRGGEIVFTNLDSGDSRATDTLGYDGATVPAEYDFLVTPGRYSVSFNPTISCTTLTGERVIPCRKTVIKAEVDITQDTVLDLDVKLTRVSGTVTLDGKQLPDTRYARGPLYFLAPNELFDTTFTAKSAPFGTTGPASYEVDLAPGEYEVWLMDASNCAEGDLAPNYPCLGGRVGAVSISGSQTLDIDIPTVLLTGHLTQLGAALPETRGGVVQINDLDSQISGSASVVANAAGDFAARLIPGRYAIRGLGALPCEFDTYPAGACGYDASSECADLPAGGSQVTMRPPAGPSTLPDEPPDEPPVETDAGATEEIDLAALLIACHDAMMHAQQCSTDPGEQSLLATYESSFCSASLAANYAACDTADQLLPAALATGEADCESAVASAELLMAKLALCSQ